MMLRPALASLTLLLASCVGSTAIEPRAAPAATDFSRAQRVEISLDSFSFAPRDIELRAGQPVVLVVRNLSGGGHNFSAPEFFAAALIRSEDTRLVSEGLLEVRGGQSLSIHLVPTAGSYELDCTHMGHAVLGMKGTITVR